MEQTEKNFKETLALMLHISLLGMDQNFGCLREHCKRLLVNVIHSIHFRDSVNLSNHKNQTKEIINFLLNNKNQKLWQRENVNKSHWHLQSIQSVQFLTRWIVQVIYDKSNQETLAIQWSKSAIDWFLNSKSSFTASRSLQIYRGLRCFFSEKFNQNDFLSIVNHLKTNENASLRCEALILLKHWTLDIPKDSNTLQTWNELLWSCINALHADPILKPHVYVHALSLLSSILKRIDLNQDMPDASWSAHGSSVDSAKEIFDGVFSLAVKGIKNPDIRMQCEEFIASLLFLKQHEIISRHATWKHTAVIGMLPTILLYVTKQRSSLAHDKITKMSNDGVNHGSIPFSQFKNHVVELTSACQRFFEQIHQTEISKIFHECTADKFAATNSITLVDQLIPKLVSGWINHTQCADLHCIKLLLDLLDVNNAKKSNKRQFEYNKQLLCILHGALKSLDWKNSAAVLNFDSSMFDKITELLSTDLWKEATMILEVMVKFDNESSVSPSSMCDDSGSDLTQSTISTVLGTKLLCQSKIVVQSANHAFTTDILTDSASDCSDRSKQHNFKHMKCTSSKDIQYLFSPRKLRKYNNVDDTNLHDLHMSDISVQPRLHQFSNQLNVPTTVDKASSPTPGGNNAPWGLLFAQRPNKSFFSPVPVQNERLRNDENIPSIRNVENAESHANALINKTRIKCGEPSQSCSDSMSADPATSNKSATYAVTNVEALGQANPNNQQASEAAQATGIIYS